MNRRTLLMPLGRFKRALIPYFLSLWPLAGWRLLPGSSRLFGPPRRRASWAHYHATTPGNRWQEVVPPTNTLLPALYFSSTLAPQSGQALPFSWPSQGLAFIPQGRVLTHSGWVVGIHDTLLHDFCFSTKKNQCKVYHILDINPPTPLPGRTLNLCCGEASGNFCHWMLDAVARVTLFRQAGLTWADVDHILLPAFWTETAQAVEAALEMPAAKLIRPSHHDQYRCETLIQPSLCAPLEGFYPAWVFTFHRQLFPPAASPLPTERLYFPRRSNRRPTNVAALEAALNEAGFTEACLHDFSLLRAQLASAKYIVGVHGAALVNLLYAAPGARVLELMPPDYPCSHYRTLCAASGLSHGIVVGQRTHRNWLPSYSRGHEDFLVPFSDFKTGLNALLCA
jgi:hypothetical protein